jgi:aldose sugar dehydrogenase
VLADEVTAPGVLASFMQTPSTLRHTRWILASVVVTVAVMNGLAQGPVPGTRPLLRPPSLPFPDGPEVFETLGPAIRVVPIVKGLEEPWSLAFLPNGDMLVTERPGRLRIVRKGVLDPKPIAGTPQVWATGQGGLLEVAPHPDFAKNRVLYLTYSKSGERGPTMATTALARARFDGTTLTDLRDIFVADNWNTGNPHFGSKIAFGRDRMLYMTVGERGDRNRAQDTTIHGGKVLRLRDDGTVPPDNPFVGRTGFRPEIYSYGHRNPQGLTFHPETGALWETEHGPQGGDELNIIMPGKNYGWPVVTLGREYTGEIISPQPARADIEQPVMAWLPSLGLSGMVFYTGNAFPAWKGNLFVGGLSGQQIVRVVFTDKGPVGREALIGSLRQRIRDVRQGPDGLLYLVVGEPAGGVLRIEPAAATDRTP